MQSKIVVDERGCWIWTASKTIGGYGHLTFQSERRYAHRFAYELLVAPVPKHLDVDHLCRVRACCNPDHLEPVTRRENLLRGDTIPARNAAKTACHRGHPFDAANLRVDPKTGDRKCRACDKENQQRYRDRQRLTTTR
jgi:hypothetical protein